MFDVIFNNSSITNFIGGYGAIVSLIALLGVPIIVLKHIIKQTKFTKLSYILMCVFLSGFISLWIRIEITRIGIFLSEAILFTLFLQWLTLFSLIGLICLILVHTVKKIKYSDVEKILLILFVIGIYSYIPRFMIATINTEMGTKMAVIPYDRQVGYYFLGHNAKYKAYNKDSKEEAYKAIKYYEKAIYGKYAKFQTESEALVKLYIYTNDYEKALAVINKTEKAKEPFYNFDYIKALIYINQNKYQEAVDLLLKVKILNKKEHNLFLISALYDEIGNKEKAQVYRAKALEEYNKHIEYYTYSLNHIGEKNGNDLLLLPSVLDEKDPQKPLTKEQERQRIEAERHAYINSIKNYQTVDSFKKILPKMYKNSLL